MFKKGLKADIPSSTPRARSFANLSCLSFNNNFTNNESFNDQSPPNTSRFHANNVIHQLKRRVSFRNLEVSNLSRVSS